VPDPQGTPDRLARLNAPVRPRTTPSGLRQPGPQCRPDEPGQPHPPPRPARGRRFC